MKKITAILLVFFYLSTNASFAFSELYYLKNIKTGDVAPTVDEKITEYGFNIIKQNPYYAISQSENDYAVIILQQSGDNMFYYYQADNNTKINKAILREIKRQNIVCEQSFNSSIIGIYDNLAQGIVANSGEVKRYSFEEPESVFTPPSNYNNNQSNTALKGYVTQLAAGTKIEAYLQNAINTSTATKGDSVVAVLSSDLSFNGIVIAPQGSLVYGSLSKARNATYGSRNGRVVITFDRIVTPENKVYEISTEEIDFDVTNEGKFAESAKNAISSAAVGAILGMLFSAFTDRSIASGAAIGAGMGAGSSVVYSVAERGVDAEIPSFTELEITLSKPLNVSVSY